jgi:hypothetical protein
MIYIINYNFMKGIISSIIVFVIGVIALLSSGADGYWESMNTLGYIGMSLCLIAILYIPIIGLVKMLIKKINNK